MIAIQTSSFLKEFQCLADRCEDTCCKGWGMQLDRTTKQKYEREAPELLAAVDTGEAEWIMKRDPQTDYCVKFDQGICSVHRDYGTSFLGDACHFYPRITRQLGSELTSMTASLSCPEVTRLALFGEQSVGWEVAETDRVPDSLTSYLIEGLSTEQAWSVHQAFLTATYDTTQTIEQTLARIISVSFSLHALPVTSWPEAVSFYLKNASQRLPVPDSDPADPFNLLHMMYGLVRAAKPSARPRLDDTLSDMAQALEVTIDSATSNMTLSDSSVMCWQYALLHWQGAPAQQADRPLRRWLQAQLTMMLFPFAGIGSQLAERVTLLALRFAVTRQALICAAALQRAPIEPPQLVRIVQSLSRFLDHLADPTLSLDICRETGWLRESRLRALIGDGTSPIPSAATLPSRHPEKMG